MNIERTKSARKTSELCVAPLYCAPPRLAQDVKYNSTPGTNFAKYHTDKWADCGGRHPRH
jgi:hypothetical protein